MKNKTENNGLDFSKINPNKHQKYSPNLFKYLKKNIVHKHLDEAWLDKDGYKWLGYINDEKEFFGAMLNRVLCLGVKESSGCYYLAQFEGLTKVQDFWSEYIRMGRCAIDKDHDTHFINSESRYIENETHRECTWCGQKQFKRRWEETINREEWVNYSHNVDFDLVDFKINLIS